MSGFLFSNDDDNLNTWEQSVLPEDTHPWSWRRIARDGRNWINKCIAHSKGCSLEGYSEANSLNRRIIIKPDGTRVHLVQEVRSPYTAEQSAEYEKASDFLVVGKANGINSSYTLLSALMEEVAAYALAFGMSVAAIRTWFAYHETTKAANKNTNKIVKPITNAFDAILRGMGIALSFTLPKVLAVIGFPVIIFGISVWRFKIHLGHIITHIRVLRSVPKYEVEVTTPAETTRKEKTLHVYRNEVGNLFYSIRPHYRFSFIKEADNLPTDVKYMQSQTVYLKKTNNLNTIAYAVKISEKDAEGNVTFKKVSDELELNLTNSTEKSIQAKIADEICLSEEELDYLNTKLLNKHPKLNKAVEIPITSSVLEEGAIITSISNKILKEETLTSDDHAFLKAFAAKNGHPYGLTPEDEQRFQTQLNKRLIQATAALMVATVAGLFTPLAPATAPFAAPLIALGATTLFIVGSVVLGAALISGIFSFLREFTGWRELFRSSVKKIEARQAVMKAESLADKRKQYMWDPNNPNEILEEQKTRYLDLNLNDAAPTGNSLIPKLSLFSSWSWCARKGPMIYHLGGLANDLNAIRDKKGDPVEKHSTAMMFLISRIQDQRSHLRTQIAETQSSGFYVLESSRQKDLTKLWRKEQYMQCLLLLIQGKDIEMSYYPLIFSDKTGKFDIKDYGNPQNALIAFHNYLDLPESYDIKTDIFASSLKVSKVEAIYQGTREYFRGFVDEKSVFLLEKVKSELAVVVAALAKPKAWYEFQFPYDLNKIKLEKEKTYLESLQHLLENNVTNPAYNTFEKLYRFANILDDNKIRLLDYPRIQAIHQAARQIFCCGKLLILSKAEFDWTQEQEEALECSYIMTRSGEEIKLYNRFGTSLMGTVDNQNQNIKTFLTQLELRAIPGVNGKELELSIAELDEIAKLTCCRNDKDMPKGNIVFEPDARVNMSNKFAAAVAGMERLWTPAPRPMTFPQLLNNCQKSKMEQLQETIFCTPCSPGGIATVGNLSREEMRSKEINTDRENGQLSDSESELEYEDLPRSSSYSRSSLFQDCENRALISDLQQYDNSRSSSICSSITGRSV